MHVENDLVVFGTVDDQEYEDEIFVSEEFQEPPVTDTTDTAPAQGKTRCINRIFDNHYIYTCGGFTLQKFYETHMHIYLSMSLTGAGSYSCFA
jgi:hypothetical protein